MSDLHAQFERAAREVMELPKRPDDKTLLRLYGLYKQATSGNILGKRPGFTDVKGRAKYDALSLIHISEPTRLKTRSRMPSSA